MALNGGSQDYQTQLATPSKHIFDDRALYFFFGSLMKEALAKLMETMPDSAFGYDKIKESEIGSDRASRRQCIADLQSKLSELEAKKAEVSERLSTLGISKV